MTTTPKTLDDAWSECIPDAMSLGLVEFVFKYSETYYISVWNKGRWRTPRVIHVFVS